MRIFGAIRKSHRFLSLFGAAILFLTFLVKEGKQENLRDLSEKIRLAEARFIGETDKAEILSGVFSVGYFSNPNFEKLFLPGLYSESVPVTGEDLKSFVMGYRSYYQLLVREYHAARRLSEVVTRYGPQDSFEEERARSDSLQLKSSGDLEYMEQLNQEKGRRLTGEEKRRLAWALNDIGDFSKGIAEYSQKIVQGARELEEARRSSYDKYSQLSYVLYAAGWLCAFLGKLLEPSSSKSELDIE